MREIGSEFWEAGQKGGFRLFLSGRAALACIIQDVRAQMDVRSVLLPSYCCQAMIAPFTRQGIQVRFYDVYYAGGRLCAELPDALEGEMILLMGYFGYGLPDGLDTGRVRSGWRVIVEDCTHSWLGGCSVGREACDYQFTSYRKWAGFGGIASALKYGAEFCEVTDGATGKADGLVSEVEGLAGKADGLVSEVDGLASEVANLAGRSEALAHACENLRLEAERLKGRYIKDGLGAKEQFRELYARAEVLLESGGADCLPSIGSICRLIGFDAAAARRRRRENAEVLTNALKGIGGVELMYKNLGGGDNVPLHVPVLIKQGARDALQRHLAGQGIYCPVHWPLSRLHSGISVRALELYGIELSLVCDQRYGEVDMLREANAVRGFLEGTG